MYTQQIRYGIQFCYIQLQLGQWETIHCAYYTLPMAVLCIVHTLHCQWRYYTLCILYIANGGTIFECKTATMMFMIHYYHLLWLWKTCTFHIQTWNCITSLFKLFVVLWIITVSLLVISRCWDCCIIGKCKVFQNICMMSLHTNM